jgi:hypothetical protein
MQTSVAPIMAANALPVTAKGFIILSFRLVSAENLRPGFYAAMKQR